jgi:hypothetical protein
MSAPNIELETGFQSLLLYRFSTSDKSRRVRPRAAMADDVRQQGRWLAWHGPQQPAWHLYRKRASCGWMPRTRSGHPRAATVPGGQGTGGVGIAVEHAADQFQPRGRSATSEVRRWRRARHRLAVRARDVRRASASDEDQHCGRSRLLDQPRAGAEASIAMDGVLASSGRYAAGAAEGGGDLARFSLGPERKDVQGIDSRR